MNCQAFFLCLQEPCVTSRCCLPIPITEKWFSITTRILMTPAGLPGSPTHKQCHHEVLSRAGAGIGFSSLAGHLLSPLKALLACSLLRTTASSLQPKATPFTGPTHSLSHLPHTFSSSWLEATLLLTGCRERLCVFLSQFSIGSVFFNGAYSAPVGDTCGLLTQLWPSECMCDSKSDF
jgi:hypothetical protein